MKVCMRHTYMWTTNYPTHVYIYNRRSECGLPPDLMTAFDHLAVIIDLTLVTKGYLEFLY